MGRLLTIKERLEIRKRNLDNPDIEALLAEGDELRRLWTESDPDNLSAKELEQMLKERKYD